LEKGRKPEKRREPRRELGFYNFKVRVRLTLMNKYMIVEITINMLGISF